MKRLVFVTLAALLLGSAHASAERVREWHFTVYLDDNKIGYHHVRVEGPDEQRSVAIDAKFDVKFLFFNAYRYRHDNQEVWSNGCLQRLASRTDDNGELLQVEAEKRGKTFVVDSSNQKSQISGCVKSFAYWDPSFLTSDKLLNAQTGEHLNVNIQQLGTDHVDVKGKSTPALRYRLTARDLNIDLWYSPQREWLALESQTNGGRLRYRII
jgi:hypothetical protein